MKTSNFWQFAFPEDAIIVCTLYAFTWMLFILLDGIVRVFSLWNKTHTRVAAGFLWGLFLFLTATLFWASEKKYCTRSLLPIVDSYHHFLDLGVLAEPSKVFLSFICLLFVILFSCILYTNNIADKFPFLFQCN